MLASTGIGFCNYFFFSTLPIYVQKMTGTATCSGLMMGLTPLRRWPYALRQKYWPTRCGRTRLIIIGAAICTLACGLYEFSSALGILLFVRVLHGVGFGIHSTTGGAIAVDVIPKGRMEGLAYFGIYGTLAAAVAPGLALGGDRRAGLPRLFVIATLVAGLRFVLDCRISYERGKTRIRAIPSTKAATDAAALHLPKILMGFECAVFMPGPVTVLMYMALSSVVSFLPMFALARGVGNAGLFFAINALGLFLSRTMLSKITDRYGANCVIMPGLFVLAGCFAIMPFARSTAWRM